MSTPVPSGYAPTDDYYAVRYRQVDLILVSVQLTLAAILSVLLRPDPDKKLEENRRINLAHAKRFATYVYNAVVFGNGAIIPPLHLHVPHHAVEFDRINVHDDQGQPLPIPPQVEFGWLRIQKALRELLRLWDGQHRVLGLFLCMDRLLEELKTAQDKLLTAQRNNLPSVKQIKRYEDEVTRLRGAIERFNSIAVAAEIAIENDPKKIKRYFSDIADNALGISKSVVVEFDDRKVYNRVAVDLAHGYLNGLVDQERNSLNPSSPYLTTLRDLEVVIRMVDIGPAARWSQEKEAGSDPDVIANQAIRFIDGLRKAFPEFDGAVQRCKVNTIRADSPDPSLLGSSVTLKALAVVYHALTNGKQYIDTNGKLRYEDHPGGPMTHDQVVEAFRRKLPPMAAGDGVLDQRWIDLTGIFGPPWTAPVARTGNDRRLATAMIEWARR